jgi:hypothetical protein
MSSALASADVCGAGVESKTSVLELGREECGWGDSKLKDDSLRSSDIV